MKEKEEIAELKKLNEKSKKFVIVDVSKKVNKKEKRFFNPFAEPLQKIMVTILTTNDINKVKEVVEEINKKYGQGQFKCSLKDYNKMFGFPY